MDAMKKFLLCTAVVVISFGMTACGDKTDKGNPEADSLQSVVNDKMAEIDEMSLFLDAVNASMDSIVNMDGTILRTVNESTLSRKNQIKQNLETYKLILQRQRERLATLEEKLKTSNAKSEKMLRTIASLKKQLDEKDQAIVELTEELGKRNFDIQTLKKNVTQLNTQVAELEQEKKEQEEALVAQSDMMNEAYVLIASKKDLKAAGIVTGGSLFKKSKLDMSTVNASAFKKIDIRKTKSFDIPAKKSVVLTQMPSGSYSVVENSDGTSTLTINDPARFWSVSNFLVVKY